MDNTTAKTTTLISTKKTSNNLNLTICLDKAKLVLSSDEDWTEEHYTPEDIDAMFELFTLTNCSTTTMTAVSRKKPN